MSPHGIAGTGPMFTKVPQDLLGTNAPHCAKFHRDRPNHVHEKSVGFFLHQSVFWRLRDPQRQSSPILILMYSKAPTSICQVSLRSDKPSTRYRLPNFVYFVDCLTHKNSTRHVSAYHAATIRFADMQSVESVPKKSL